MAIPKPFKNPNALPKTSSIILNPGNRSDPTSTAPVFNILLFDSHLLVYELTYPVSSQLYLDY
ncbi:MAG: hypothetical protein ACK504_11180 [Bacteroidota bacterium]